MKKRILSNFCALLLCLGLLTSFSSVGAVDNPCFMAVNDNLLDLEAQFIPIAVSGQYYVPYTALDSSVTGIALGIFPIYNTADRTLTIYDQERVARFDLNSSTCVDRGGAGLNARAVIRNGRVYVPARFVADYFGLTYSYNTSMYGPVVRIRSASSRLSDRSFVAQAQQTMELRLLEWRRTQTDSDTPTITLPPAPTSTVSPTPGLPETDKSHVRAYLAFRADKTEGLEELLSQLEERQVNALFFFPAEDLAGYDDAVRAVLCGGHAVGLLAAGASAQEVAAQAAQGNRVLEGIAHLNTYTVLAPGVTEQSVLEELSAAGLLCWSAGVDALPDGGSASYQAGVLMESIGAYSSAVYILSDASAAGAALTERLLDALVRDRYDLRLAVETEF